MKLVSISDTEVTLAKNGKLELSMPCERILLSGAEYEVETGRQADELVRRAWLDEGCFSKSCQGSCSRSCRNLEMLS